MTLQRLRKWSNVGESQSTNGGMGSKMREQSMTPEQIIQALEKYGDMTNVAQMSNNEYQGNRKGRVITAKLTKYRGQWQLVARYGTHSVPSNTFPWQAAVFDSLHWNEVDR